MKRRVIAALCVSSVALMGCSSLDTDTAARVDDVELTDAELFERLGVADDDTELIAADEARAEIQAWIGEQVANLDVEAGSSDAFAQLVSAGPFESDIACVNILGAISEDTAQQQIDSLRDGGAWADAVTAASTEIGQPIPDDGYQGCRSTEALFTGVADQVGDLAPDNPYGMITLPDGRSFIVRLTPTDEVPASEQASIVAATEFEDSYNAGPDESGVVCSAHILVATAEEADEVVGLLDDGASFAEVAAARSTDPGSAAAGGSLGCQDLASFTNQFIPEYTDAALAATIDEPTDPVESQFGFHVIKLLPFDEVALADLAPLVGTSPVGPIPDGVDIEVSPTYGYFDPALGVVPLG